MNLNAILRRPLLWSFISIILLCIIILLPVSPVFRVPGVDSGVFLYMGSKIINGQIPYLNLWDHKPPAIYYINALGLLLGQGNLWGVWALELLSLIFTGGLLFETLRKQFHILPAILSTLGMIACLPVVLSGGNLTEEYGLLFQVVSLWLFCGLLREKNKLAAFFIGVSLGFAFLLKQTLIGLWAVIFLFWLKQWLFDQNKEAFSRISLMILGSTILPLITLLYFYRTNALVPFIDAAFGFNFVYAAAPLGEKLLANLNALVYLFSTSVYYIYAIVMAVILALVMALSGLYIVSGKKKVALLAIFVGVILFILGYLLGGVYEKPSRWFFYMPPGLFLLALLFTVFYVIKNQSQPTFLRRLEDLISQSRIKNHPILIVAVVDMFVELILASISVRGYLHYYIPLLPSAAVLVAYLLERVYQFEVSQSRSYRILCVSVLGLAIFVPAITWVKNAPIKTEFEKLTLEAVKLVDEKTVKTDKILILGSNSSIYFLSQRDSMTPYFYQYPLLMEGYADSQKISEFINDIDASKPQMIINMETENIINDAEGHCFVDESSGISPKLQQVFGYVCSHYRYGGMVGGKWTVYEPMQ